MNKKQVELLESLIWAIVQKAKLDTSETLEHWYSDNDIDDIKEQLTKVKD